MRAAPLKHRSKTCTFVKSALCNSHQRNKNHSKRHDKLQKKKEKRKKKGDLLCLDIKFEDYLIPSLKKFDFNFRFAAFAIADKML